MKRQMLMLSNLNCPSCAAKVEQATRNLTGMRSARLSFGSGLLSVEYDEGQLSEAEIREVVHQFGVSVATVLSGPGGAGSGKGA